jgi:hypothetical protein
MTNDERIPDSEFRMPRTFVTASEGLDKAEDKVLDKVGDKDCD